MGDQIDCLQENAISRRRSTLSSVNTASSPSLASFQGSIFSNSTTSTTLTVPDRPKSLARSQSCEVMPHSLKTRHPWRADRSHVAPLDATTLIGQPQFTCKELPDEIINGIVVHICDLYPREKYQYLLNDLRSFSLTSTQWRKVASRHLYHTLWIPANNLQAQPRRFFLKPKSRLKLLQRTLRQQPTLAGYAREIHVLDYPPTTKDINKDLKTCCDSLASLVMSCPQLERITGFYPTYHNKHDSIFHALAARQSLKEHTWIIGARERLKGEGKRFLRSSSARTSNTTDPDFAFRELHSSFHHLETLAITFISDGASPQSIPGIFKNLPSLKNLHLSSFASQDFETSHLKYLPRSLTSLRLESLPGVSEQGLIEHLSQNLSLEERRNLRSLSLIDMDIHSLLSINALLDNLPNLQRLVLVTSTLLLSQHDEQDEFLHPFLSSKSLQHLHWDIGSPAPPTPCSNSTDSNPDCPDENTDNDTETTRTNTLLAESILADAFPNLKSICAPQDPTGAIQSVCKPLARPIVRAAAAGAGPYFKPYYDCDSPPPTPLIHRATSIQSFTSTKTAPAAQRPGSPTAPPKQSPATAAYHRAAVALSARRRVGRDPVARFKFDVLEEVEPYITLFVHSPRNRLEAVLEFPPFLGRVGCGVPEYVVDDRGLCAEDEEDGKWVAGGVVVGLRDVVESGGRLGVERLFW